MLDPIPHTTTPSQTEAGGRKQGNGPPPRLPGQKWTRYDIITGIPIHNEPTSGYKEGQRAVIETLAHVTAVTNQRTPHYNIVTGRDALQPSAGPVSISIPGVV
ncbi:hypothetical protein HK097_006656 [Rhizophlyctis rosea]|uniref:Uncharacterized protein n=1 Tax=Rhizophlyctis rosea TaxID=64517 RepID=A0AAD5WXW7_9FUNG|nr:hypothetical protein HK097_006656 [Rhizophlyctis rosea]